MDIRLQGVQVKHAIITELLDDNLFQLVEPVEFTCGPMSIVVPAGYVTDFASLPAVLHWWIRPTDRRAVRAAVIHDWIYHTHILPRVIGDAIFQVVLRIDGMPRRKAKLLSTAVRSCGKRSYMGGPDKLKARSPHLARFIRTTPDIE